VIFGLNQGQERLPENHDPRALLIQEVLATRPLFGVDLLVVHEVQLEGDSHPSQFKTWFWTNFSVFSRGFLALIKAQLPCFYG